MNLIKRIRNWLGFGECERINLGYRCKGDDCEGCKDA
jgi:hypothetical protein